MNKLGTIRRTMTQVLDSKKGSTSNYRVRFTVLRLYAQFQADNPILRFPVDNDQARKIHPSAIGLLDRDKIQVRMASLGIQSALKIDDKKYYTNTPILHHADANFFNGPVVAPFVVTEAQALEMLYNSKLSIDTDELSRQDDLDTSIFKFVGHTQTGATTSNEYDEQHIQDLGRDLLLVGGDQTDFVVKLENGQFAPAIGTDDRENYAVLQLYSVVTKNAAKKRIQ